MQDDTPRRLRCIGLWRFNSRESVMLEVVAVVILCGAVRRFSFQSVFDAFVFNLKGDAIEAGGGFDIVAVAAFPVEEDIGAGVVCFVRIVYLIERGASVVIAEVAVAVIAFKEVVDVVIDTCGEFRLERARVGFQRRDELFTLFLTQELNEVLPVFGDILKPFALPASTFVLNVFLEFRELTFPKGGCDIGECVLNDVRQFVVNKPVDFGALEFEDAEDAEIQFILREVEHLAEFIAKGVQRVGCGVRL